MFKRFYKNRYGYSRWDGTQNIEGLDADDILNALSDDYMEEGNLQQAALILGIARQTLRLKLRDLRLPGFGSTESKEGELG